MVRLLPPHPVSALSDWHRQTWPSLVARALNASTTTVVSVLIMAQGGRGLIVIVCVYGRSATPPGRIYCNSGRYALHMKWLSRIPSEHRPHYG